jgi:putative hydrolase of the HAD superfamily
MQASYAAVVFDLFGTLVPAYAHHDVLSRMATILGLDPRPFVAAFAVDTREARETGRYGSLGENIQDVCHRLEHSITDEQLHAAVRLRRESIAKGLHPRNDALPTLSTLRRRRLSVGLISDCCHVVPELWSQAELARYVDAAIFSCQVGLRKPDPEIYSIACEALGVQATTCLYVGDGGSNELSGAARLGMDAVLLSIDQEQGVDPYRPDAETWQGRSIKSLSEVVDIV